MKILIGWIKIYLFKMLGIVEPNQSVEQKTYLTGGKYMLALYTEAQLGAAYQIYARVHADNELDIVEFETFRTIFEHQFIAMSKPESIFDGVQEGTKH